MTIHSKHLNGNLVFYDGQRWFDAVGETVKKFLEDFVGPNIPSADAPGAWTVTLVEGGAGETTLAADTGEVGGALVLTTDAAENDGANLQLKGEAFKLQSSKPLYFGARLKISDATQSDFIVGLCITDTDLLGGMTDGIYFRKVDGSATVSNVLELNSSETTGTALTCDTSYHIYEILWDGTNADFYVDGTLLTRLTQTNLPNDEELTPSIHFLTGEAVAKTMTVDWLRCIQLN